MLQGFPQGERVARISGNEGMQQWPFWLDVEVTALKPLIVHAVRHHHGWFHLSASSAMQLKHPMSCSIA